MAYPFGSLLVTNRKSPLLGLIGGFGVYLPERAACLFGCLWPSVTADRARSSRRSFNLTSSNQRQCWAPSPPQPPADVSCVDQTPLELSSSRPAGVRRGSTRPHVRGWAGGEDAHRPVGLQHDGRDVADAGVPLTAGRLPQPSGVTRSRRMAPKEAVEVEQRGLGLHQPFDRRDARRGPRDGVLQAQRQRQRGDAFGQGDVGGQQNRG